MRKKGFTLLELIVVIIVLGILASFAIPQFINVAEKGRAGEGLSLLPVIAGSQTRYAVETGDYATATGNLDVELPVPKYFTITVSDATPGLAANERIAFVTRNATDRPGNRGAYILSICENGRTYCTDGVAGDCLAVGQRVSGAACP